MQIERCAASTARSRSGSARSRSSSACGSRSRRAGSGSGAGCWATSSGGTAARDARRAARHDRALTDAIALYRSSGYVEITAFNDEPFAHHWFEKMLG